jgi:hypothetical protein
VVLVEASVFGGHNSVLEVGRDAVKRYEIVARLIRLLVHHRLDPPLDLQGSEGRVDPTERSQSERSRNPGSQNGSDTPSE